MNIAIGVKNFNISLIIQEEILKISQKFTVPVNISIFTNGIELLIEKNKFDIIFIDTDLNDINSIQISNCIRLTDNIKKLIFISDEDELIFNLLKYQPYRFIRKRYFKSELNEAIISIFKSLQDVNKPFICRNGNIKIPVNLNEIYFFEIFAVDAVDCVPRCSESPILFRHSGNVHSRVGAESAHILKCDDCYI